MQITGRSGAVKNVVDRRNEAASSFIRGYRASSFQGESSINIPASLTSPKGVLPTLASDIAKIIREQHLPANSMTTVTGIMFQPKGGSTGHVWTCRCKKDAGAHEHGCRCRCTACLKLEKARCPSHAAADKNCPPLCPCTCAEHHRSGEEQSDMVQCRSCPRSFERSKRRGQECGSCANRKTAEKKSRAVAA